MAAPSFSEAFPVVRAFDEHVVGAGFRPAQMTLVAFLVTFGCVRAYTHAVRHGRGPGDLSIGGVHIHHMVPGIFLLLGAGFVAIAVEPDMPWWLWWLLPTAFGVGAALVLDEFALWLNLRDVYWTEEGRRSIDAVIVAAALGAMVALGAPFWGEVITGAAPPGGAAIVSYHALSILAGWWGPSAWRGRTRPGRDGCTGPRRWSGRGRGSPRRRPPATPPRPGVQ